MKRDVHGDWHDDKGRYCKGPVLPKVTTDPSSITNADIATLTMTLSRSGGGCSRTVYDLGDHVLKVDHGKNGNIYGGAKEEMDLWDKSANDDELRRCLCPVVAGGVGWCVMVKAQTIKTDAQKAEVFRDARCYYRSAEYVNLAKVLSGYGIIDLHEGNIGWIDKGGERRLVAIDYAY